MYQSPFDGNSVRACARPPLWPKLNWMIPINSDNVFVSLQPKWEFLECFFPTEVREGISHWISPFLLVSKILTERIGGKEKSGIKFRKVVRKSFLQINVYKVVEQLLDDFLLCSVPVWHHSSLPHFPLSISYQKV